MIHILLFLFADENRKHKRLIELSYSCFLFANKNKKHNLSHSRFYLQIKATNPQKIERFKLFLFLFANENKKHTRDGKN